MPTSGTVNFLPDFGEIIEEAYERAGLELKTGYDLRTARRSLDLLSLEWQNRGINLWTVEQKTLPLSAGVATYSLLDDTVDVLDGAIRIGSGVTQSDIGIERKSYTSFLQIPNKNATGRPMLFTILRGSPPTVTFWYAPDAVSAYTFVYYRMRRIQDSGTPDNIADVPARFVPAMISGLAYMLAMKRTEAADRVPLLKAVYDEQFEYAVEEDRDRSTFRVVPGGYSY